MIDNIARWFAPAKLNLFLHITGKREDGYHNLQTLFQLLDYGDDLQFIPRQDNAFIAKYDISGINPGNDLILKAAMLLFNYLKAEHLYQPDKNYGVDIYLQKKLPMGGGLGGGSSDAATTLIALNQLWGLNLEKHALAQIGLKIGADIPVFVNGKSCWAEGVGENLIPYDIAASYYVVVVPDVHICTAELFTHTELKRDCKIITNYSFEQTVNVFEPLVRKKYPAIEAVFEYLSAFGEPRLTGTGACVFISQKTEKQCQTVIQRLPNNCRGFYAKTI